MSKFPPYKDLYEKALALNVEYRQLLKSYMDLLQVYAAMKRPPECLDPWHVANHAFPSKCPKCGVKT